MLPMLKKTAITFEYQVPSLEEFEERIEKQSKNFLIWLQKKREFCKGYAYASAYYNRAAYDWTVELSIYIREKLVASILAVNFYASLEKKFARSWFC